VDPNNEAVGSTASGIEIIVAQGHHIPIVQGMLSDAFHRAADLGYHQWWDPFPVAIVENSVILGETYVALEGRTVVGTIALSWEDPMFWGKRPPDAGYVHRLCTDAAITRRGLGTELLSWADTTIANHGREWLRLDTPASNQRLRSYYESLAFTCRGETDVTLRGATGKPEIWRAALFERAVPTSSVR
jgi:ribosomal protein S18 acetylase RimI-like enzyme